nr:hypothetical protein [Tanacetum cinerariifolium]
MTSEPYDDVRGRYPKDDGTRFSFEDNTDLSLANAEGFADVHAEPKSVPISIDSIVANENSRQLDATSDDEKYEYEGEEFGNFDLLFGSDEGDLESTVDGSLRRSVEAMNKEMEALNRNNTWVIIDRPNGRKLVGCKWIYKIKYKSNGKVERYKARLVAKGCSQKEGLYCEETFSPIVNMVSVRCVLSLVMQNQWSIFQLDVNNAFLVCKLKRSLYGLKQAPRKWNEKLSSMLIELGFSQSNNGHSLFVKSDGDVFAVLLVYVDDIIITGKLIYLTISYDVHKLSHVMHGPLKSALKLAFRVLRYLKGAPGKGVLYNKSSNFELCAFVDSDWAKCNATWRFVFGFVVFLSSCLVSWKSKKQSVLAKSSAEAEYRAISAAMRIAANPVFHERKNHFTIDLYFLREKIAEGVLKTCKVQSQDNVADVLTKGLELYVKLRIAQGVKVSSG